jgi:hypothetical protein
MERLTRRAKGGKARAAKLTPIERSAIARKGGKARWGEKLPVAISKGNFSDEFGIDIDCYVLDDLQKTAVISQRGMGQAIGLSKRGDRLIVFSESKNMAEYIGRELMEKIQNPIIFQWVKAAADNQISEKFHGYDVTILVDLCRAILAAKTDGKLSSPRYERMVEQAQIIISASAKLGIKNLVYALTGYNPTVQEVIEAFKIFVQEEARKYEKEFPTELYAEWQRLYNIEPPARGKNWKEMHLTVDHVYYPLAKSNGELLELLRSAKMAGSDRNKKLFQFLSEVGAKALRMHLGRVLEMAQSSSDKKLYEAKIAERFGMQAQLSLPIG